MNSWSLDWSGQNKAPTMVQTSGRFQPWQKEGCKVQKVVKENMTG
jgi:hypothetical protein